MSTKFWAVAWDGLPKVYDTEAEARADGEASRHREIARLQARIEHVRTAHIEIVQADPDDEFDEGELVQNDDR